MSNKRDHRHKQAVNSLNDLPAPKTLIEVLENTVLAIESSGCDEQTIFGLVNCILRGWIVEGNFTEEYRALVAQTIEERNRLAEEQARKFGSSLGTGLVDSSGRTL